MIDYILLAEFDDLKGKMIRYSHPSKISDLESAEYQVSSPSKKQQSKYTAEDRIAEMIIPDTGNDRMIDTVFFIVNRPSLSQIT